MLPKTGLLPIRHFWIPAYAGMTVGAAGMTVGTAERTVAAYGRPALSPLIRPPRIADPSHPLILNLLKDGRIGWAPYPGKSQASQLHRARPIISSLSAADSQGSSSVNRVMHCRQEQGIRVMSVPQNIRSGPKAS